MFDWLFQPIPFHRGFLPKFRSAASAGIIIFLVVFLLRPFGSNLGLGSAQEFFFICVQFGLVTFFTTLIHGFFQHLLEKKIEEPDWLVWKTIASILILISMIGMANWLFVHFAFGNPLSLKSFLSWQYMTFVVGIIPTMVGSFLYMKNLLNKYTDGAGLLNQEIAEQSITDNSSPIFLKGENRNEELNLNTEQLLYITSANNYVEIFYKKAEEVEKKMIRSTLKKMENQLAEHSQFFRCHKTYLVNLNQVETVSGNAQGYKLHLKKSEKLIPVSRSLNDEISKRFSK